MYIRIWNTNASSIAQTSEYNTVSKNAGDIQDDINYGNGAARYSWHYRLLVPCSCQDIFANGQACRTFREASATVSNVSQRAEKIAFVKTRARKDVGHVHEGCVAMNMHVLNHDE